MATLVFAAIGNAILPGAGQFLGALAGAYVDNFVLFPPKQEGPKLDDLSLQSGSEGAPLNYALGAQTRMSGVIIWISDLVETKRSEGAKGGPEITSYSYSVDVAVAFCEGPISSVRKIWANGKLLYDDEPDITVVSTQISASSYTWITYQDTTAEEPIAVTHYGLLFSSPSGGPNLKKFRAGKDIVSSGWSTGTLNGTFRCISATRDDVTGATELRFEVSSSLGSDAGGESVTLFQDLPKFAPEKMTSITFYTGTSTQLADGLLESHLGIGNVPGYRDVAYAVIEGLVLTDYGNSLPQMEAWIKETSSDKTLASAITQVCARSGRPAGEFSASAVTGTLRGLLVRGPTPIVDMLKPMLTAHDVLTQEDQGVLKFFMRTTPGSVTVVEDDLAAAEGNDSEVDRPMTIETENDRLLPSHVEVTFTDPARDLQDGSQVERKRWTAAESISTIDLLGMTLSAVEAKAIARRILWQAWANRDRVTLTLPVSYVEIGEGDLLRVTADGKSRDLLVLKVERGYNGVIKCDCAVEHANTLSITNAVVDTQNFDPGEIYVPPQVMSQILELPPLRDSHVDVPGFCFAAALFDHQTPFRGCTLFRSTDSGASYQSIAQIVVETTMGTTSGTLGSVNSSGAYWDLKSTLTVTLIDGTLESHSELDVLNGANWALVGQEVIAFKTATLTAARTYALSGFLRGLRNTTSKISGHSANELFVLLNDYLAFAQIPQAHINASHLFRTVPTHGVVSDYSPVTHTLKARNLKPFPPCDVKGERDVSNNLTISWKRRTRALVRLLGGTSIPIAEEVERYEIDILNVAETLVLRTIAVTELTSTIYSAANQTTDGLTPGDLVHMKLYMKSAIVGRGKAQLAVV